MKTKTNFLIPTIAIFLGLAAGYFIFSPGNESPNDHASHEDETTWTCSMHPQIQLPDPGPCPICGMALIPMNTSDDAYASGNQAQLSENAKALAKIETTLVKQGEAIKEIHLFGKVSYDETRLKTITARFPARIDRLFVNATGIDVHQGDHLARVYSQDLLATQTDLISSMKFSDRRDATIGPRERLRQWGFTKQDIEAIAQSQTVQEFLEINAPIGGTVIQKSVMEGDHVKMGAPLFQIADLTHVWITLDVYESDLPWIHYGQTLIVSAEGNPGETFEGKVSLVYPEIDTRTRTAKIRVSIPNPNRGLMPGQFVRAILKARVNAKGKVIAPNMDGTWVCPMHPEIVSNEHGSCSLCQMDLASADSLGLNNNANATHPLLVPSSAVLRTGKRAVVYIETNTDQGSIYEGRVIKLGPKTADSYIVLEGLNEGDRVVTNGAFKIDSFLQIQAKPSMMSMVEEAHDEKEQRPSEVTPFSLKQTQAGLPIYFDIQQALANDDFELAQEKIKNLHTAWGHNDLVMALMNAETIEDLRRPHFVELSDLIIASAKQHQTQIDQSLFIIHCPMVDAKWLQTNDDTRNPYYGHKMIACGNITEEL